MMGEIGSVEPISPICRTCYNKSFLGDGSQIIDEGIYGKPITDPCLGWKEIEELVLKLQEMIL